MLYLLEYTLGLQKHRNYRRAAGADPPTQMTLEADGRIKPRHEAPRHG